VEEFSAEKATSGLKGLVISFVGLVIALIFSALALGIANWGSGFFGITGDIPRAAAIIAVAVVIGPTIAAFATKKYSQALETRNYPPLFPFLKCLRRERDFVVNPETGKNLKFTL
jgi:hypothetical protein